MASSGNFATMNPLSPTDNGTVYSNGNLRTSPTSSWSNDTYCRSTMVIPKDKKIYVEMRLDVQNGDYIVIGCATTFAIPTSNTVGGDGSVAFNGIRKYVNGTYKNNAITKASVGDIMQIAIDGATNKVWAGLNNTWQSSGDPANGTNEMGTINTSNSLGFDIFIVTQQNLNGTVTMNFGQDDTFGGSISSSGNTCANGGAFKYTPPTGFVCLSSKSLSVSDDIDPAQTDDDFPQKQFNILTYTGNGSTQNISNLGFQPDLCWIKDRTSTANYGNVLIDSSRGRAKVLYSHDTRAELTSTSSQDLTSFDSDGFSLANSSNAAVNTNGQNYVAWCWRANGGTTSSNSSGSITSTVQSSTSGGFSIITYSGNGSSGATIGHGLSSKPEFIIVKNRTDGDGTAHWTLYHVTPGATEYTTFTDSAFTANSGFWNNTEPTSTLITLGNNNRVNGSGKNYVCYAWHGVEGYSKFSSFTGNGNTDGTFIYTGFRPRLFFIKRDSTTNWYILDTARDINNPITTLLAWDNSQTESTIGSTNNFDVVSNGLKIRTSGSGLNGSSATFYYGAWGDVPFKYNNTF